MNERTAVTLMLTQHELRVVKDALGEKTWPVNRVRINAAFERKAGPRAHVRRVCCGHTKKGERCRKGARFYLGGQYWCSVHRIDAAKRLGIL